MAAWLVSIARRRLVVLRRRMGENATRIIGRSFNRPKAISGLATGNGLAAGVAVGAGFNRPKAISGLATGAGESPQEGVLVSIARRRLVVLRLASSVFTRYPALLSFNRPKAISGLATCGRAISARTCTSSFNRPKAISGLATSNLMCAYPQRRNVSIARRRLVVLRLFFSASVP